MCIDYLCAVSTMDSSISATEGKTLESAEQIEQIEHVKMHQDLFTPEEVRKLVCKLDLWYACDILISPQR